MFAGEEGSSCSDSTLSEETTSHAGRPRRRRHRHSAAEWTPKVIDRHQGARGPSNRRTDGTARQPDCFGRVKALSPSPYSDPLYSFLSTCLTSFSLGSISTVSLQTAQFLYSQSGFTPVYVVFRSRHSLLTTAILLHFQFLCRGLVGIATAPNPFTPLLNIDVAGVVVVVGHSGGIDDTTHT